MEQHLRSNNHWIFISLLFTLILIASLSIEYVIIGNNKAALPTIKKSMTISVTPTPITEESAFQRHTSSGNWLFNTNKPLINSETKNWQEYLLNDGSFRIKFPKALISKPISKELIETYGKQSSPAAYLSNGFFGLIIYNPILMPFKGDFDIMAPNEAETIYNSMLWQLVKDKCGSLPLWPQGAYGCSVYTQNQLNSIPAVMVYTGFEGTDETYYLANRLDKKIYIFTISYAGGFQAKQDWPKWAELIPQTVEFPINPLN